MGARARPGALSSGVQRRHGLGCDFLGLAWRPRGSDGNHSRRRRGKLRHCAPDASGRTPCGDQRPIGSGQAGSPHPVDCGGDGAASAQRPAWAGGRDQLPHRSGQRRSISRRHGGRPTVPISRRCGRLYVVARCQRSDALGGDVPPPRLA